MRGYFGIGVEGISKAMNVGTLFRSAHAFDASFVFTVAANYNRTEGNRSDTSDTAKSVPFYSFPDVDSLLLPKACDLVAVELLEDAVDLPSFRHPRNAAYILGAERHGVSTEMLERCDYSIKIPMKFSINLGIAGALVMYDRLLSMGRFPARPFAPGGEIEALPETVWGDPTLRRDVENFRDNPPVGSAPDDGD